MPPNQQKICQGTHDTHDEMHTVLNTHWLLDPDWCWTTLALFHGLCLIHNCPIQEGVSTENAYKGPIFFFLFSQAWFSFHTWGKHIRAGLWTHLLLGMMGRMIWANWLCWATDAIHSLWPSAWHWMIKSYHCCHGAEEIMRTGAMREAYFLMMTVVYSTIQVFSTTFTREYRSVHFFCVDFSTFKFYLVFHFKV